MFAEIGIHRLTERIEQKLNTFTSGQLGGRHKIAITGDEDDRIDLLLERESGDVETDAHINAFLAQAESQIIRPKFFPSICQFFQPVSLIEGHGSWRLPCACMVNGRLKYRNPILSAQKLLGHLGAVDVPTVFLGDLTKT